MLKLNVGFNRKTGEANYGSRGASVNLELELDSSLVGDADRLKDRIRQLFMLAKASVDEELAGNGPAANNGQQQNGQRRSNARRATASQARALHAIADRQKLNLASLLSGRYSVQNPEELSITEASSLIDELKASANGNGAHR
ncbi:MAG TPA: hypothetical protein VGG64_17150 [Pirellulales bacterium]|jgi:hypothetical protein